MATIPLAAAAAAMREAMRETVKRYSLWYLLQGILMVAAGLLALIYPVIASIGVVFLLAWILIVSGIVQGIGLIGARQVPHFWLQLISVVLSIVVGLLLLRNPEAGLLVFSVLLIVYFMVEGMAKVISGLSPIGAGFSPRASSASRSPSISGPICRWSPSGSWDSCSASSSWSRAWP